MAYISNRKVNLNQVFNFLLDNILLQLNLSWGNICKKDRGKIQENNITYGFC